MYNPYPREFDDDEPPECENCEKDICEVNPCDLVRKKYQMTITKCDRCGGIARHSKIDLDKKRIFLCDDCNKSD